MTMRELTGFDRGRAHRIDERAEHERREELERVDVEEHHEEKERVQHDHRSVP